MNTVCGIGAILDCCVNMDGDLKQLQNP